MTLKCPICKKTVELASEYSPFCSDRCRLIDLGNWATEKYVISSAVPYSDEEEIPEGPPPPDDPI